MADSMNISARSWLGAGFILAFVGACGPTSPDSAATDANATDTTGQSTSTTSTPATTTTATTTTTVATTTTATSETLGETSLPGPTTSDDFTTGTETTASTTGGSLPDLQDSCVAFCTTAFGCFKPNPYPDLSSCGWACIANFDAEQPACTAADIEVNTCLGGLACPDLLDALAEGDQGACGPAIMKQDEVCPPRCQFGFVTGGASACTISQTCPDQLPTSYECSGDLCVCKVGDEVQNKCPSAKVCAEGYEDWAASANACCGFDY